MLLSLAAFAVAYQATEIPLTTGIGISSVSQGGRAPVGVDAIQAVIVNGNWKEPHAGDKVAGPRGERAWTEVKANKDGVFDGGPAGNGYVDIDYESDAEKPMLLNAAGDTMVYINGVPRAGDPYSYGFLRIPFLLKKGHNEFLFLCGRGSLKAKLIQPGYKVQINPDDMTLPDVVEGKSDYLFGSVIVENCSPNWIRGQAIGSGESATALPDLAPWEVRKVSVMIDKPKELPGSEFEAHVRVGGKKSMPEVGIIQSNEVSPKVRVRKATEHYKETFLSDIDGSTQYFAVCPSLKPEKSNALIMTVHGASVEAIGQAAAYAPKDWCTIVAPTNRRPYGFDWEDWGRMDAMEVWNIAKSEFPHDPKRVILTGHSMGGHGTWTLGLTYPNEFAAIGPSAGWISFWSYAGGWTPREPNAVETLMRRSMNSSDTLLMLNNAKMEQTYILHGDKDDNVPVEQAREMKQHLTDIGADFQYHEQPGAGHWWGNQCVDWPPMFEMFDKSRYEWPDHFEFTTVNPGVSASCRGITVQQQIESLQPSKVAASRQSDGSWKIETKNVAELVFDPSKINVRSKLDIDGKPEIIASGNTSDLDRVMSDEVMRPDGQWLPAATTNRPKLEKTPNLSGPIKNAFRNNFVYVVGTHGTKQENDWAMHKALYDEETWAYRANGSFEIIRDDQVDHYRKNNLILLGNADTNSAFRLIRGCPLQVRRGSISIGGHTMKGEDNAALYLYPEGKRMIGVIGGTGMPGLRYTERMPYFTSGVAYPDWTIIPTSALEKGSKGIAAAGFFGNDWGFDPKQSAFLGN